VLIALTRPVSASLGRCELTHRSREPIDVERAAREHGAYEVALRSLGATIVRAEAAPDLPDAVFVEDAAIVLDEVAVISRPGAPARRAETASVADALGRYRTLLRIAAPATLDGGDVLRLGRTLYVGRSSRTNREAIAQLEALLRRWDYRVIPVEVGGCLHLKSAVTPVADRVLVINPVWVPPRRFAPLDAIPVAPREPAGANALLVNGAVIYPEQFPRTAARLESAGVRVVGVPCGEIAKAEGGVTCCSLVFEA
jgi:dimethylargininase